MATPGADLFVFDFDGTLVDTAGVKRSAFFEIFPPDCAEAVRSVLDADPNGSRHAVIPRMIAAAGRNDLDTAALVRAYAATVARGVADAPAVPGAADALAWASAQGAAYVFSVTPQDELDRALDARGWTRHLRGVHGYPQAKPQVLAALLDRHGTPPDRAIVIGDGSNDAEAAQANGCHWMEATAGWPQRLMQGMTE